MSYSISLSGHGAAVDDVKEVFENTVRALRAVTPEGSSPVTGSAGGSDPEGGSFTLSAIDVTDLEAEDTSSDEDQEEASGEALEDSEESGDA